ncbi:hypothetical protein RhiJN_12890 [Ceratobasidium sp. AG-Ba]|nr:hypothetical protein RhiJN_12890 [Ceratobasidium sp. AG-Ba]
MSAMDVDAADTGKGKDGKKPRFEVKKVSICAAISQIFLTTSLLTTARFAAIILWTFVVAL